MELSKRPGDGTNANAPNFLNGQRLAAVQDLGLRYQDANDSEVLDRLEEIVLADEDTAMPVEAVKAIAAIFSRDPQGNKQDLARRLQNLLKNDREEVCQQVAIALAELGPDGRIALEALWARLGATSLPTIRDSIARAILMVDSNPIDDKRLEAENPLLNKAFDKLVSPDTEARRAGVMFLTTNVGWGLLMRSEYAMEPFLDAYRALGYRLVDRWENPEKRCEIPFHPEHSLDRYHGFCFRLQG